MRPPRKVPQFLLQARAAEQEQRDFFKRLEAEGWTCDPATGVWSHPKSPGVTIER